MVGDHCGQDRYREFDGQSWVETCCGVTELVPDPTNRAAVPRPGHSG